MIELKLENDKKNVLECLENVGIDAELELDTNSNSKDINLLALMDSLQYVAFISEIENRFNVVLSDVFLQVSTFDSIEDFVIKLSYYVNGWKSSLHNIEIMKGGYEIETKEIEETSK